MFGLKPDLVKHGNWLYESIFLFGMNIDCPVWNIPASKPILVQNLSKIKVCFTMLMFAPMALTPCITNRLKFDMQQLE